MSENDTRKGESLMEIITTYNKRREEMGQGESTGSNYFIHFHWQGKQLKIAQKKPSITFT